MHRLRSTSMTLLLFSENLSVLLTLETSSSCRRRTNSHFLTWISLTSNLSEMKDSGKGLFDMPAMPGLSPELLGMMRITMKPAGEIELPQGLLLRLWFGVSHVCSSID